MSPIIYIKTKTKNKLIGAIGKIDDFPTGIIVNIIIRNTNSVEKCIKRSLLTAEHVFLKLYSIESNLIEFSILKQLTLRI